MSGGDDFWDSFAAGYPEIPPEPPPDLPDGAEPSVVLARPASAAEHEATELPTTEPPLAPATGPATSTPPDVVLESPTPTPPPAEPGHAAIIVIANQKGGVGKTTTAVNLGAALAEAGERVLVVDLDPQGNATTGVGIDPRGLEQTVYQVLVGELPIDDIIEPTSLRNLYVAPANLDLAGAEVELVPAYSRELRLRKALEPIREDYTYILIDCPPSLGLLTVNALAAGEELLLPIQCEYYALEGVQALVKNVHLAQRHLNPNLRLGGVLLTMHDARTKLADQVVTEVREHFGDLVFRQIIPRNVRLSEAPSYGQPIVVFDPMSRGAIAYREVAKEVIRRHAHAP